MVWNAAAYDVLGGADGEPVASNLITGPVRVEAVTHNDGVPDAVALTVIKGPLAGREYRFEERTTCIMGRAPDCSPRLPDDEDHRIVSRHHCLLDINPPQVRIRDFGSLNGTYVNGVSIGRRPPGQSPSEAAAGDFPERDLADADEIRLGNTVLRVSVRTASAPRRPTRVLLRCALCARDVSDEVGGHDDEYVCDTCRTEPARVVTRVLRSAADGDPDLAAFVGYTVVRELGAGGMGRVYLVRDATGRLAALKAMLPRAASDREARERFLREIAITQSLRHPNIATLHHSGNIGGAFFFTSEYCAGGSLHNLIRLRGTLPPAEAVPMMTAALAGLDHAHTRGVVHRDITPHNILLTDDAVPVVKLADFGLAKAFDDAGLSGLTRTGTAAGKPYFMPYQQIVNFRSVRPEVDVWALAACLYYTLTGTYPRDFPPERDPWQVVLQSPAVPVRARRPDVPRPLAAILDRALVDKPDIGFSTAAELRHALLLQGL